MIWREALGKFDIALDWLLSESVSNSVIGYLNNSYPEEEKTRVRLKI